EPRPPDAANDGGLLLKRNPVQKRQTSGRRRISRRSPDLQQIPQTKPSSADAGLLDQNLVAPLVGALEVVEQLPALRHECQQSASRMIVFHVSLEMLGEIVDPL